MRRVEIHKTKVQSLEGRRDRECKRKRRTAKDLNEHQRLRKCGISKRKQDGVLYFFFFANKNRGSKSDK
jgi:hypothetical protein